MKMNVVFQVLTQTLRKYCINYIHHNSEMIFHKSRKYTQQYCKQKKFKNHFQLLVTAFIKYIFNVYILSPMGLLGVIVHVMVKNKVRILHKVEILNLTIIIVK
jgi:hypothetical protein